MASNQAPTQDKVTDAAKANIERTADQSTRIASTAQDGLNKVEELRDQTAENTRQIVQTSFALASQQARDIGERFTRSFGVGSEDSQRLAEKSKQNLAAVSRGGTVLTQAFHDVSRDLVDLNQKQWQRNVEGLQRLAHARTPFEFASVQSELVRESLQHLVEGGRVIGERSLRANEEAGKAFANAA